VAYEERLELIRAIEAKRGSRVICYMTSLRPNLDAGIHMSDVRVLADHLLGLGSRHVGRLDLFLCSNGGDVNVPWRMLSMLREYTDHLGILIPFSAYSAATMIALGADDIVMHPFGLLGPIDPSVRSAHMPEKEGYGILPLNVEDVRTYLKMFGANGDGEVSDSALKGLETLLRHVHPVTLGGIIRTSRHARDIASKILALRFDFFDPRSGDTGDYQAYVEKFFDSFHNHSHAINRREAKDVLKLPIAKDNLELEQLMWRLYADFERQFGDVEPMDLASQLHDVGARQGRLEPDKPWNVTTGTGFDYEDVFTILESGLRSDAYVEANRATVVGYEKDIEPTIKLVTTFKGWRTTVKSRA
jgi:hypothetical protein